MHSLKERSKIPNQEREREWPWTTIPQRYIYKSVRDCKMWNPMRSKVARACVKISINTCITCSFPHKSRWYNNGERAGFTHQQGGAASSSPPFSLSQWVRFLWTEGGSHWQVFTKLHFSQIEFLQVMFYDETCVEFFIFRSFFHGMIISLLQTQGVWASRRTSHKSSRFYSFLYRVIEK